LLNKSARASKRIDTNAIPVAMLLLRRRPHCSWSALLNWGLKGPIRNVQFSIRVPDLDINDKQPAIR